VVLTWPSMGSKFHEDFIILTCIRLTEIKVIAESTEKPAPIKDFKSAGLHPVMVDNIDLCLYDWPTPIQAYTIPAVMKGFDVIATAQTGECQKDNIIWSTDIPRLWQDRRLLGACYQ
jgi:hypothetical protein